MELEGLMHDRFKLLLQSNSGLSAALSYSRSRPPLNLVPLFDSLDDAQAAALMRGGGSRVSWGPKVRGANYLSEVLLCFTCWPMSQAFLVACWCKEHKGGSASNPHALEAKLMDWAWPTHVWAGSCSRRGHWAVACFVSVTL